MTANLSDSDTRDLGTQALEIAKRRQQAALAVLRLLDEHASTASLSHPETALFAAAWLAGTSLYRSFGYAEETAPGTVVLSEKANDEWPKLMKVFMFLLAEDGVKVGPDEPTVMIPAEHRAKRTMLQIQEEFQDAYNEIMKAHGFDYFEGAKTGAVVCAMLVKAFCLRRKDLEPALAAGIVGMGFIEGAKTAPVALKASG